MTERLQEYFEYDQESDLLDVYFAEPTQARERPFWTIELTDNITISIDRAIGKAVAVGLLDFSRLTSMTPFGPRSFPITGLANLPPAERDLVLEILKTEPVRRWLDISSVQLLPDSPFTVAHVVPQPSEIGDLLPISA